VLLAAASVASATTTYVASGTAGGVTIDAQASFTFTNTTLTLTLTNLLDGPTTVAQNISDFEFTIASLSGTTPTLTPYTGASTNTIAPSVVTITSSGFTTNTNSGQGFDPGWAFSYSAGNFALNGLAGAANVPAYTIVGPPGSGYPDHGSLLTDSHNPFINQSASWVFNINNPGGNPLTVTNIVFSFGTVAGDDFYLTPEPASWLLLGTGLAGLLLVSRKAARRKTA
jgi:hypothetical protein